MDINFVVIFFSFVRLLLILGLFDKPLLVMQVGRQVDVSISKINYKGQTVRRGEVIGKGGEIQSKKTIYFAHDHNFLYIKSDLFFSYSSDFLL